jgi:serine/threonine protein kinase
MLSGKFPFKSAKKTDVKYKLLIAKSYDKFWQKFEKDAYFSPEVKELLQKMLAFNPEERITLEEIS